MSAAALLGLAERVEAAAGPDRELDARIWLSLGYSSLAGIDRSLIESPKTRWLYARHIPAFTTSLDAAKALVPEGWSGRIGWCGSAGYAELTRFGEDIGDTLAAATAPLALTAAALRARAAIADRNGEAAETRSKAQPGG